MSQTLLVLPEAEKEVFEAASWYEERSARLATDFYDTFQSALAKIVENPYQYQVVEHGIRRAPRWKIPARSAVHRNRRGNRHSFVLSRPPKSCNLARTAQALIHGHAHRP
jgi:hypothetical protein